MSQMKPASSRAIAVRTRVPLIGGILTDTAGWRAVPSLLFLLGAVTLVAARAVLPETSSKKAGERAKIGLVAGYVRLGKNPNFVMTTVALATSAMSLYMYLGAAPFLFSRSGMSPTMAGVSLVLVAVSIVAGTRLVKPAQRNGGALLYGTMSSVAGAIVTLALALIGLESPFALLIPVMLIGVGAGMIGPAGINGVAFAEPGLAATATSLAGALQMLASSASMSILSLFSPLSTERVAIALLVSTVVGLVCALARIKPKAADDEAVPDQS